MKAAVIHYFLVVSVFPASSNPPVPTVVSIHLSESACWAASQHVKVQAPSIYSCLTPEESLKFPNLRFL